MAPKFPVYYATQGDIPSSLAFQLLGPPTAAFPLGQPQDLTGFSSNAIRVNMWRRDSHLMVLDHALCVIIQGLDPVNYPGLGWGRYDWQAADLSAAGVLEGQFVVSFPNSSNPAIVPPQLLTFPNNGRFTVEIAPRITTPIPAPLVPPSGTGAVYQ